MRRCVNAKVAAQCFSLSLHDCAMRGLGTQTPLCHSAVCSRFCHCFTNPSLPSLMQALQIGAMLRQCFPRSRSRQGIVQHASLFHQNPTSFCANLHAHVATMAPLGFNAAALGVVAHRSPATILGSPDALAAQFIMLRKFFSPWSDEVLHRVEGTTMIPSKCLPCVIGEEARVGGQLISSRSAPLISRLHKAVLVGPVSVLEYTGERLQKQMHTLLAAGVSTTEEGVRQQCMSYPQYLPYHKLEWYLRRKAAIEEVGGTFDQVLSAYRAGGSLEVAIPWLMRYMQGRCAGDLEHVLSPLCLFVTVSGTICCHGQQQASRVKVSLEN